MVATYDPLLILLSVVIAILGAYAGLRLARGLLRQGGTLRKALLSAAAVTIGGGIWSMHFVGMLALELPVAINYDVLLTLISALVSILVTGIGLSIASYGEASARRLAAAGIFMGLGISSMHYIGMAAVRANCVISYSYGLVATSVLVGIAAATLALWLAFNLKGPWQTFAAAVVMGLAISGMHYTAMAAATFLPVEVLIEYAAPALSPYLMAIVVALAAFLIFGLALLIALPDQGRPEAGSAAAGEPAEAEPPAAPEDLRPERLTRLPVERNKTTLLLDLEQIVSIQAEAHYTRVSDGAETYFCSFSLSELEARLDPAVFLRVHRSHIINLKHARAFEKHREQALVRLGGDDGASVPVSRRNVPRLREALGLPS
ncbi:MAG: MHYT domain-containing protein [Kiloniellales bacterium]|nr:MHYT domain-containing protein [Kiloniellales bacterium]MDJ0980693.1 MHYT domain-containing protein [Kiloniellales bacterium]